MAGGELKVVTNSLDRGVSLPVFGADAQAVYGIVADDGSEYPARIGVSSGDVKRLVKTGIVASGVDTAAGHVVFVASRDDAAPEVYSFEHGTARVLSHQHDAWTKSLKLGAVEDISFREKDGTEVHGLVTKPPDFEAGKKYPMVLRIHGGPNWQSGHDFNLERQLLAANGYVVLAVNYRGSYGRGAKYGESILGRLGKQRGGRSTGGSGSCCENRSGRSGQSWRGRLELWRDSDRLFNCVGRAVQSGD
jgi:dipeptidyl aminopeptidase/acylaminoacyl peptidase